MDNLIKIFAAVTDGIYISEIQKKTGLTYPTIARVINYLDEKGFLQREGFEGGKRKIYFTEKGRECIHACKVMADA